MGSGPIDPKELLKGLDCFLGRDGEVKTMDGISKIFSLMKDSQKMVSRCIYLNILLQTRAQDILAKFIRIGGYKLLNTWLTGSKAANNVPFLQQLLLTLQHLPLTVDHLKQNNTAKLVKQLSKSSDDEELRRLASILVSDWMGVIRSQSSSQPTERDKKKKKEENKSKTPVPEKPQEAKNEAKSEEMPEKKREKPKSLRTTAPSHAKFRSTGLELETPSLAPVKKLNSASSDKYSLKPVPVKRQSAPAAPGEAPLAEKKYKPLNTAPNAAKEIKVKIIPPQPMEGLGFLDALNSAPVPGIKIKKKKKVLSPTAAKPSPFEGKPAPEPSTAKPSSPEPAAAEPMDTERPGTPVPAIEVPEPMDTGSSEAGGDSKATDVPSEGGSGPRRPRKKKSVSWPEEGRLREYFYFELDETERVNVNKIKDFGEAAKREMLKDRHAFETARRLSHDSMEEKVPWAYPKALELPAPLVIPGSGSRERFTQAERVKGILQEIFLSKESIPDSPHEPDPESYEPLPPKLIPLDEDCSGEDGAYPEGLDPGNSAASPEPGAGAKLPPVLANLMGSVGAGKGPPGPPQNTPINMQEILSSIMGGPSSHKAEELLKQPDYSDKIKHLLGNLQAQPPGGPGGVPHGLLGPGPMNGFPPPKMQHFPPGGPMPGPHGGGGGGGGGGVPASPRGSRGVPACWAPPPLSAAAISGGRGLTGAGEGEASEGAPPAGEGSGGPPPNGGGGGGGGSRGGPPPPPGGHGEHGRDHPPPRGHGGGHGGDMSSRAVCRHFMLKGSCRYENNCAFYHPGVNGPPLP
ncbi:LOW QUALITY PROTEIN: serine/threonine-protein phosphatase 1 regulatory subunit 10 [Corvus moneduloides]|uniref:LOW QUALITY PROTEIN: serine/threonine-protein phosphatase 1 regulatory subunit 10 n=1 Tax=Corvus moneduloides TaxID=1196302 RepID=UPI001364072A|nr:LOW QUALITY PROTEIN: serine/threonine-protein phosphatase 1 regulatory subunit 10 [Corvus moneduloides]